MMRKSGRKYLFCKAEQTTTQVIQLISVTCALGSFLRTQMVFLCVAVKSPPFSPSILSGIKVKSVGGRSNCDLLKVM
jgi:hypothetical protein